MVRVEAQGAGVGELTAVPLPLPLPFCCRRHTQHHHHTMHAVRLAYSRATIPCCQPLELDTISDEAQGWASTTRGHPSC